MMIVWTLMAMVAFRTRPIVVPDIATRADCVAAGKMLQNGGGVSSLTCVKTVIPVWPVAPKRSKTDRPPQ